MWKICKDLSQAAKGFILRTSSSGNKVNSDHSRSDIGQVNCEPSSSGGVKQDNSDHPRSDIGQVNCEPSSSGGVKQDNCGPSCSGVQPVNVASDEENTMEKRGKQSSRKRKIVTNEDGDKQNEAILEELQSINPKNAETALEKKEASTDKRKRPENKSKDKAVNPPKKEKPVPKSRKPTVAVPPVSPKQKKPSDEEKEAVAAEKEVANDNKTAEKGDKISERGEPVPNLPNGWRRQSVVRRSGKTAGQIDIYFYSPDGVKLRSRPDVVSYLTKHKSNIKIEEFDFSKTLKMADAVAKKKANENSTTPKKKSKPGKNDKKLDGDEPKESTKAVSAKKSRSSEKSAKVPPPDDDAEEKNDADGKPNAVLVKVVDEPKRKRPRK